MKFAYNLNDYDNGSATVFEGIPQNITVPIYLPDMKGAYIACHWYRCEHVAGADFEDVGGALVYWYNGEFCIFSNNVADLKYEKLANYGKIMINMYYNKMQQLAYSKDFDQFIIWNTSDPDDQDITYLKWKLGKTNTFKSTDGGKYITFTTDGTQTRAKLFCKFMAKKFYVRLQEYVALLARNMRLNDKIEKFVFDDPKFHISDFVQNAADPDELIIQIGVNGTNYYSQTGVTEYETSEYDTERKSVVKYSPYIYLMDPIAQKVLFVHELVHTKIGGAHGHDEYFWHLFEVYSGFKRQIDGAYRKEQEAEDTAYFNKKHNITCAELIRRNKMLAKKAKW